VKHDDTVIPHESDGMQEQSNGHTLLEPSDGLDDETYPRLKAISKDKLDTHDTNGDGSQDTLDTHDTSKNVAIAETQPDDIWEIQTTQLVLEDDEDKTVASASGTSLPIETLLLPAFHLRYIAPKNASRDIQERLKSYAEARDVAPVTAQRRVRVPFARDGWLISTFITACIVGSFSLWYFFEHHQTLLYGDANAHLLIARRLIDNITPGLAQLGGVWLPLPHLLMVPFVWNDYLWRTGLAGSIVSFICYIVASIYVFLSARRLTKNGLASFVGTLVFILNPNILYLQSTPLSELVLIATLTAACYYFLAWAQTDSSIYLILAAGTMFLATLSRYDGWATFLAFLALIVLIGWLRHHSRTHIEGNVIIFASLGGLGIILWFVWNALIFGDPLYFQHGPFSAQAQQSSLISEHLLYTYHDLVQSIRFFMIDCIDIIGPILFILGVIALIIFLWRRRITPETLAALAFLAPIPYYIFSLYSGQASLYLPTAVPGYAPYQLFNARYGEVVVVPAAIFLAFLADFLVRGPLRSSRRQSFAHHLLRVAGKCLGPLACTVIIIGQAALIANTGIITLQDGEYGLACTPTHSIVIYLAQHYAGGKILEDLYTSKIDTLESTVGIDFKNMVYEGSGSLWTEALSHPQWVVDWIIVNTNNPDDSVSRKININSSTFTSQYSFVLQEPDGLTLYHRNGLPPLPFHPVPRSVFTEHLLCGLYNPVRFSQAPAFPSSGVNPTGHQHVLLQERKAGQL